MPSYNWNERGELVEVASPSDRKKQVVEEFNKPVSEYYSDMLNPKVEALKRLGSGLVDDLSKDKQPAKSKRALEVNDDRAGSMYRADEFAQARDAAVANRMANQQKEENEFYNQQGDSLFQDFEKEGYDRYEMKKFGEGESLSPENREKLKTIKYIRDNERNSDLWKQIDPSLEKEYSGIVNPSEILSNQERLLRLKKMMSGQK
jgi:hypothetical protein